MPHPPVGVDPKNRQLQKRRRQRWRISAPATCRRVGSIRKQRAPNRVSVGVAERVKNICSQRRLINNVREADGLDTEQCNHSCRKRERSVNILYV